MIYELAFHLKQPVYILLENMPYDEFLKWFNYLDRRPIDWRDDFRASQMMMVAGDKRKAYQMFDSLERLRRASLSDKPEPTKSLVGSTLYHKMLSAIGGDKLELK
jgi:hypothetical protein